MQQQERLELIERYLKQEAIPIMREAEITRKDILYYLENEVVIEQEEVRFPGLKIADLRITRVDPGERGDEDAIDDF